MSINDVTSQVSHFYDRFPYPDDPLKDGPPLGFNWRWSIDNVYSFCTGAIINKLNSSDSLEILDAGCGSGVSTDYLALLNPGSNILAIDISEGALKVATERLKRSGGEKKARLRFKNHNLLDISMEGPFDYINSIGVLHHLKDPLLGLKALGSVLKPGGILHLFLYARSGRRAIHHLQETLKLLNVFNDENEIELARELIKNLPKNNYLRRDYEERWAIECQSDVHFADMYLHPRETTFDLKSLLDLIEKSNLEFISFSNPQDWQLSNLMNGELLKRANSMPYKKQMLLIENLNPDTSHFEFFLTKGPLQKYKWERDEELLLTSAKLNNCMWGWPGRKLHDSDMHQININSTELKFLQVVENSAGTSLGLLPLDWDKSMIASTARDLQRKQLLLLDPL